MHYTHYFNSTYHGNNGNKTKTKELRKLFQEETDYGKGNYLE